VFFHAVSKESKLKKTALSREKIDQFKGLNYEKSMKKT